MNHKYMAPGRMKANKANDPHYYEYSGYDVKEVIHGYHSPKLN